jgi:hypothetical protein
MNMSSVKERVLTYELLQSTVHQQLTPEGLTEQRMVQTYAFQVSIMKKCWRLSVMASPCGPAVVSETEPPILQRPYCGEADPRLQLLLFIHNHKDRPWAVFEHGTSAFPWSTC